MPQDNKIEKLTETIDKLAFVIDTTRPNRDYSQYFVDIMVALKELGNGYRNDGCLNKIHHELHLLNKTLIISALILGATKNPEKTLDDYNKIIKDYLD